MKQFFRIISVLIATLLFSPHIRAEHSITFQGIEAYDDSYTGNPLQMEKDIKGVAAAVPFFQMDEFETEINIKGDVSLNILTSNPISVSKLTFIISTHPLNMEKMALSPEIADMGEVSINEFEDEVYNINCTFSSPVTFPLNNSDVSSLLNFEYFSWGLTDAGAIKMWDIQLTTSDGEVMNLEDQSFKFKAVPPYILVELIWGDPDNFKVGDELIYSIQKSSENIRYFDFNVGDTERIFCRSEASRSDDLDEDGNPLPLPYPLEIATLTVRALKPGQTSLTVKGLYMDHPYKPDLTVEIPINVKSDQHDLIYFQKYEGDPDNFFPGDRMGYSTYSNSLDIYRADFEVIDVEGENVIGLYVEPTRNDDVLEPPLELGGLNIFAQNPGKAKIRCRDYNNPEIYADLEVTVKAPFKFECYQGNPEEFYVGSECRYDVIGLSEKYKSIQCSVIEGEDIVNLVWQADLTRIEDDAKPPYYYTVLIIEGLKPGKAVIRCVSGDNPNVYADLEVNVISPITFELYSGDPDEFETGDELRYRVMGYAEKYKSVIYEVIEGSDVVDFNWQAEIGSVGPNSKPPYNYTNLIAEALKAGRAVIRCSASDNREIYSDLEVIVKETGVRDISIKCIAGDPDNFKPGDNLDFEITFTPQNATNTGWKLEKILSPDIFKTAIWSETHPMWFRIQAEKPGKGSVRVTSLDNEKVFMDVPFVIKGVPLEDVSIRFARDYLLVGEEYKLVPDVSPIDDEETGPIEYTWNSLNPQIADFIPGTSILKAIKAGRVTIKLIATSVTNSVETTMEIEVKSIPLSLDISSVSMEERNGKHDLKPTEELYLCASLIPADANYAISWKSNSEFVEFKDSESRGAGITAAIKPGINVKDVVITAEINDIKFSNISNTYSLTISDLITGDADDDKEVDVADAVTTGNWIIGLRPSAFCFVNADSNTDREIDVADLTATIDIILHGGMSLNRRSNLYANHINETGFVEAELKAKDSKGDKIINLYMKGDALYNALQAEIEIPDGAELEEIALAESLHSHSLLYNPGEDGIIKFVIYSPDNTLMNPGDKPVLSLRISGAEAENDELQLSNIITVDNDLQKHFLEYRGWTSNSAGIMGVGAQEISVASGNGSLLISGAEGMKIDVYSLDGKHVLSFTPKSDKYQKALQPGIYLIRTEDITRKIIVK